MNQFVLDASVAVKWAFDEPLSGEANRLLALYHQKKIKVVVPEFFYCEFASVCWKKTKKKLATTKEVLHALDDVIDLSFQRYSDHELSDVALENALKYDISVYDGLYLALAEIYSAPLVTADEVLLKACRGRFDFIESLSDISLPSEEDSSPAFA